VYPRSQTYDVVDIASREPSSKEGGSTNPTHPIDTSGTAHLTHPNLRIDTSGTGSTATHLTRPIDTVTNGNPESGTYYPSASTPGSGYGFLPGGHQQDFDSAGSPGSGYGFLPGARQAYYKSNYGLDVPDSPLSKIPKRRRHTYR